MADRRPQRAVTMNFGGEDPQAEEAGAIAADEPADYGSTERPKVSRRATFAQGEQHFPSRHKTWTIDSEEPSMNTASMMVNLLADLTPAGILPLSNGMLNTGYVPAVILLVLFAFAAAYMMYLISRSMEITGQKSFAKMWVQVVGPSTAWVPPFVVFSVCFGCCLAYACMFGDLFGSCMPGFGVTWATRSVCLVGLGIFPLLPLCFMKDLSALAPTSFGALVAVLYTLAVMVVRYVDKSYALGGQFYKAHTVETASHMFNFGPASLSLVNALAVSFLCHYNGCKYYREYIGHTPGRFKSTVGSAFTMVVGIFAVSMLFGYMTFDAISDSVILNNYSQDDMMVNVARFGMGLANVFSFPLMFSGLREQLIELICFVMPSASSTTDLVWFQNLLSTIMLAIVTCIAILVTDASIVIGLVGSLCGSATIYVIPCLLFDQCTLKSSMCDSTERTVVRLIGFLGVFCMIAGAIVTVVPM
jgi:sodium-coupled neutral amino acid transporter 11